MNIVILDGYTLNPGDLSWGGLENAGKCTIYERTAAEEVVPRAQDAEILLTNKTPIRSEAIAQLPRLKYIGVLATGTNVGDLAAARVARSAIARAREKGINEINISFSRASQVIDALASNGWKPLPFDKLDAILHRQRQPGEDG